MRIDLNVEADYIGNWPELEAELTWLEADYI